MRHHHCHAPRGAPRRRFLEKHHQKFSGSQSRVELGTQVGAVERSVCRVHTQLFSPSPFLQPDPTCLQILTRPLPDRRIIPRAAELFVSVSTSILKSVSRKCCRTCNAHVERWRTPSNSDSPLLRAVTCCVQVLVSRSALPKKRCTVSTQRRSPSFDTQSPGQKHTRGSEVVTSQTQHVLVNRMTDHHRHSTNFTVSAHSLLALRAAFIARRSRQQNPGLAS